MQEPKRVLSWEKNPVVRVNIYLTNYKGRDVIDIREYYLVPGTKDEWMPTRKGICLDQRHISKLLEGIQLASDQRQKDPEVNIEEG